MDPILTASRKKPPGVAFTCNANHKLISRHAINALTTREQCTPNIAFRNNRMSPHPNTIPMNINHFANPMVHPVTGDIVSSYKKAMNDTNIGELWKTAFGKEFRGLAQGDMKTKNDRHQRNIHHVTQRKQSVQRKVYLRTCVPRPSATERRPVSHLNHRRWKPHQIRR